MGNEGLQGKVDLPPGFRFFPTDEELVVHYLSNKLVSHPLPAVIIGEVDLYKYDPWQLPEKAVFGEKEWYFFTPRDRKYPNGSRPNRAAGSGYWKATGADKPIISCGGSGKKRVGVKKALVFYKGKAPKGCKTNWIMHEYRLAQINMTATKKDTLRLDDWVLCRIYNKKSSAERIAEKKMMAETAEGEGKGMFQMNSEPSSSTPMSFGSNPFYKQMQMQMAITTSVPPVEEQIHCNSIQPHNTNHAKPTDEVQSSFKVGSLMHHPFNVEGQTQSCFKNPYQDYIDTLYNLHRSDMILH